MLINQRFMSKKAVLEDAIAIAAQAHRGQKEKAGMPYILHPLRLIAQMKTEDEMIVAVLHDVVEDCEWTLEQLREKGFSAEVISAVECLTHQKSEDYTDYIERVQKNPLAKRVKIADLEDNMDIRRISEDLTEKDFERLKKYQKTWRKLKD